jgi:hypothetical protein
MKLQGPASARYYHLPSDISVKSWADMERTMNAQYWFIIVTISFAMGRRLGNTSPKSWEGHSKSSAEGQKHLKLVP